MDRRLPLWLDDELDQNKIWVRSQKTKGRPADLRGRDIRNYNLDFAELEDALAQGTQFQGTRLWHANLTNLQVDENTRIAGADLTGATVTEGLLAIPDILDVERRKLPVSIRAAWDALKAKREELPGPRSAQAQERSGGNERE